MRCEKLKGVSPYKRAKFRSLLKIKDMFHVSIVKDSICYCVEPSMVERAVALRFAVLFSAPASERGSADHRGKLWAVELFWPQRMHLARACGFLDRHP